MKNLFPCKNGFALVDLLVAIGIFSVVSSIAAGGFLTAMRTQRQESALIAANTNVALALEQVAREIRTGSLFCRSGTTDCPNYPNELYFVNASGEKIDYSLSADGAIERGVANPATGVVAFSEVTGSNVKIEYLNFVVSGNLGGGGLQPRITIAVGVSAKAPVVSGNVVNLQTTISPRPLDI